jgi:hypothetical protein
MQEKLAVEAVIITVKTPEGAMLGVITVFYNPETLHIIDVSYKGAHG